MKDHDSVAGLDPELAELLRTIIGASAIGSTMMSLPDTGDHMLRAFQVAHQRRVELTDSINRRLLPRVRP